MHFTKMVLSVAALALVGASLAGASIPAAAQTQYRILVGYPPGGVQDQEARIFANTLREATGRPFVVETRTGAAGQLAAEALLLAPADGATLLMTADSNISVYPHTVKKAAYTPLTDFVPIAHTGDYRIALAVGAAVPASDLQTFIKWTQAQPGPSGYGTAGAGTNLHFYGVLLAQATGARMYHVPYRGTGPAIIDLIAGHIPAAVLPLGSLLPHVNAGKVRVLGQTGDNRSASLPDVPSFKELGYPALSFSGWYGLFARAGTPADMVDRYNEIVVQALRTPEIKKRMREFELDIRELTPQQFLAMVKADTERWGPVIRSSGFTARSE